MATTHDGVLVDLPPNYVGFGVALAAVLAFAVAGYLWVGACVASLPMLVAALVAVDRLRGNRRVRVTKSKLLMEDTRPVRGFLIGPSRYRVAWTDLEKATVDGDSLRVRTRDGAEQVVVGGCASDELAHLLSLIERAKVAHP